MTQLSFYQPEDKGRSGRNGADMWCRYRISDTGLKTVYIAISRSWVLANNLVREGEKSDTTQIAIDVGSRVLVSNKGPIQLPHRVTLKQEGSKRSSFYNHDQRLVKLLIDTFLCDTSENNHYFQLERDGVYNGHARFNIVKL